MSHLGCYSCGFVETVGTILLNCAEYQIIDGDLRCPICESPLRDVSPQVLVAAAAALLELEVVLDPLWYEGMAAYDLRLP